jgi:hypothetical protein
MNTCINKQILILRYTIRNLKKTNYVAECSRETISSNADFTAKLESLSLHIKSGNHGKCLVQSGRGSGLTENTGKC